LKESELSEESEERSLLVRRIEEIVRSLIAMKIIPCSFPLARLYTFAHQRVDRPESSNSPSLKRSDLNNYRNIPHSVSD
jgi:hypothetical protein